MLLVALQNMIDNEEDVMTYVLLEDRPIILK
ncbi:MAG: hypothetical protein QG564_1025 [Campylobacterota bacterium]|nr:hypothetical protein [Campylobacterota bacterium]